MSRTFSENMQIFCPNKGHRRASKGPKTKIKDVAYLKKRRDVRRRQAAGGGGDRRRWAAVGGSLSFDKGRAEFRWGKGFEGKN